MTDRNSAMIRVLAEAERLMDEGKIPFVMAKSPVGGDYERLAVDASIMKKLGLEQGQKINSIIMEAILSESIRMLKEAVENAQLNAEDESLDQNFDFRDMMGDGDVTKH